MMPLTFTRSFGELRLFVVSVKRAYRSYPARGRNCTDRAAGLPQCSPERHDSCSRSYEETFRVEAKLNENELDEWRDDCCGEKKELSLTL